MLRAFLVFATIALATGRAKASPTVLVFNNEARFLAAVASPNNINFNGIATDTGYVDLGTSYHTGSLTFTSPAQPFAYHILVVGKDSQTLGAPFDAPQLVSSADPSGIDITFDAGTKYTAFGGFINDAFGTAPQVEGLTLPGSSGVLDSRAIPLGVASVGQPETFVGYLVFGDTITGLNIRRNDSGPAISSLVYGYAVPEPSSLALCGVAGVIGLAITRIRSGAAHFPIIRLIGDQKGGGVNKSNSLP